MRTAVAGEEVGMILVAGATGSLGSQITIGLRSRNEPVRALVRRGSDASALRSADVEIAHGDLRDTASLQAACRNVNTIISTASATRRSDDTPDNVDDAGTRNLITAARESGARNFVFISTIGASNDSPVPAFRAKGAAEKALRSSGLAWTILQLNALMDVWFGTLIEAPISAGQPVTLVGESLRRHSFLAERDAAAFAIAAVDHPAARDATLVIGGPSPVTFREVVRAYETALGRSIAVRSVPPGAPIPGVPEPVWGIAAALESFDSPIDMHDLARTFAVDLTSAEDFATLRATRLSTNG